MTNQEQLKQMTDNEVLSAWNILAGQTDIDSEWLEDLYSEMTVRGIPATDSCS